MARQKESHVVIAPHEEELPTLFLDPECDFQEDEGYECPYKADDTIEVIYSDVVLSGKRGCEICYVYSYAMKQTKLDRFYNDSEVHMVSWTHHSSLDCFYHWGGPLFSKDSRPLAFLCDARDPKIKSAIKQVPGIIFDKKGTKWFHCRFNTNVNSLDIVEELPSGDTSSDISFLRAKEWIAHCDANHDCRKATASTLPKRVISVGVDKIYIHESDGERGDYACLSHCWGPQNNVTLLKTEKETLETFKESIPWSALPRTFQNAIITCRKLGLKWIWIDSLCIVQDNNLDWELESAKMASIYENSYLTLAAAHAKSSDIGLFTPPDSIDHGVKPTPLRLRFPNGLTTPIVCRINFNHEHFPLFRRAWAYQERMLAPRILHFAGSELIWECSSGYTDCECGSVGSFPSSSRDHLKNRDWREIVKSYLNLKLTYSSDIFSALSGLADRFMKTSGDEYIAGMWKSSLIKNLIWRKASVPVGLTECLEWRAPSWSWASIADMSSSTNFWNFEFCDFKEPLAELLDARVTLSGANATGAITSASISIRAKAITVTVNLSESKDNDSIWLSFDVGDVVYRCRPHNFALSRDEIYAFWRSHGSCSPDCNHRTRRAIRGGAKRRSVFEHCFDGLQFIPNIKLTMVGKGLAHRDIDNGDGEVHRRGLEEHRYFLALIESKASPGSFERFGVLVIHESQNSGLVQDDVGTLKSPFMPEGEGDKDLKMALSERRRRNLAIFQAFDEGPYEEFRVI